MAFPTNLNQALPGLHPLNNRAGTAPRVREYDVLSTYNATIGEGCVLIKTATGVTLATGTVAAGGFMVGVAAHNLKATPGAGAKVLVYDDPEQEYACISDGTITTTVAIEAVGQFVQCLSNVYNATLGQGKTIVDISTLTSTWSTTRPYQVVRVLTAAGETRTSTATDVPSSLYSQVVLKLLDAKNIWRSDSVTRAT